jgi:hypothetical protein
MLLEQLNKGVKQLYPVLGYVLTSAEYSLITPVNNTYYIIYSNASGEVITEVMVLTQTEYNDLSDYDNKTLYTIIETGESNISNAYVGNTAIDAIYLNGNLIYELT